MSLDPNLYTVAWIAPLEIEARAALLMLDHEHEGQFPWRHGYDCLFYAGDINGHNVVIATMLDYGTGSAAALASQIKTFFPNIRFGLLVGIAAGLPDPLRSPPHDIRLGDVLVAYPEGEYPGVIAYDLGKETPDGFQLLHGGHTLPKTEPIVMSAIRSIKMKSPEDAETFMSFYQSIQGKRHAHGTFCDPGQARDLYYTVDKDGSEHLEERHQRPHSQRVHVWYGPIGSGEKLMKHASKRNMLRDQYNIIGLEMEAAGVMKNIPVGVIRGVSDYGDSHKNKPWQPYAAAMAASYAKAVLYRILPSESAPRRDVSVLNGRTGAEILWVKRKTASSVDISPDAELEEILKHIESPSVISPMDTVFAMGCNALADSEFQGFVHTRSFASWFHNWGKILTTTTSRRYEWRRKSRQRTASISSGQVRMEVHSQGNSTCPIAACLAHYVQKETACKVFYVNCSWLTDRPQHARHKLIDTVLKNDKLKESEYSRLDSILLSLFVQMFNRFPREKMPLVKQYSSECDQAAGADFLTGIPDLRLPSTPRLMRIIEFMLSTHAEKVLLSIDSMDEMEQPECMSLIRLLDYLRGRVEDRISVILTLSQDKMSNIKLLESCLTVSDDTEYKDCLASIYFDQLDARRTQVTPAAAETTSWIWSHPRYHAFSQQKAGMLWIRGKPGSGKSVLAKSLRNKLLEQSNLSSENGLAPLVGDWFYHRRLAGRYIKHESFLRSSLYHFLQQCPEIFHHYLKVYRNMDPQMAVWSEEDLEETLLDVCRGSRPTFCIVDAVDEAENASILQSIKKLSNPEAGSRAKFIVLSRHVINIERQIFDIPTIIMEDENRDDIARIINIRLKLLCEEIHALNFNTKPPDFSCRPRNVSRQVRRVRQPGYTSKLLAKDGEAQIIEKMRATLASKAHGSILWVKLVLDQLMDQVTSDPTCSMSELVKCVEGIPEELKEYYERIVGEMTDQKSPQRIDEIRQVLMWICVAGEVSSITLDALWEAIAMLRVGECCSSMDEIWAMRISVYSYDELWRKIYSAYGPFIEAYNPGFSAEESRGTQYSASSHVQLMHQTVRDFLCDEASAGSLSFSIDEARASVKNRLRTYWEIATRKLSYDNVIEAEDVIEDLENLKLLRQAISIEKNQTSPGQNRHAAPLPILKSPPSGSLQDELIQALTASRPAVEASRKWGRFLTYETYHLSHSLDGFFSVNLLYYVACNQGLVTAILNMRALNWDHSIALLPDKIDFCAHGYGILLAASRCQSTRIHVDFRGSSDVSIGSTFEYESRAREVLSRRRPNSTKEKPDGTVEQVLSPKRPRSLSFSSTPQSPDWTPLLDAMKTVSSGFDDSQRGRHKKLKKSSRRSSSSGGRQRTQEWVKILDQKKTSTEILGNWVVIQWDVSLTVELSGSAFTNYWRFWGWCPFLDLACGAKRHRGISGNEINQDNEVPPEDVEEAIVAALINGQG